MTKTHWQFDKKRIFYFNKRLDNTDRCLTCPKHESPRTSQNMFNTSFALYMITTIKKKRSFKTKLSEWKTENQLESA